MTGIERLHKLIADIDVSAAPELWYILRKGTEGDWDCEEHDDKTLGSTLADIADQIEREQGGRVSRMRVLAVVTEMERHVSGAEGMEDSPVARWARELRRALKSDTNDERDAQNPSCTGTAEAADVTSEAQKVTREDVDAIAWVREHGGLEEVEAHWSGRVPLKSVKWMIETYRAKRERLKAHALGLERKCAERRETIRELSDRAAKQSDEIRVMRDVIVETCARLGVEGTGSTVDDAQVIWREISRRLMPKGCEWDGSVLRILTAENVDYDGETLEVGQTVWDENGDELVIVALEDGGNTVTCRYADVGDGIPVHGMWSPSQLTHQRPDSWDRLEEDAEKDPCGYFGFDGEETCGKCPASGKNCEQTMALDIVRRAKALAGRDR